MILSLALAIVLTQQSNPPKDEADALARIGVAAERLAAAAERLSPPPPPEDKSKPAPKPDLWAGSAGLGLTWVPGNVTSIAFIGSGQAIRKGEHTIFVAKGFAGYGEKVNDAGTANEVLLYNAGAAAQFDYRFTPHISALIGAGLDMDHVKSVELRGYGDLGVGVLWLDLKEGPAGKEFQKLYLKTDVSLRVQPESRFQYYPTAEDVPDVVLVGPRLALSFRYSLSKATAFQEDAELLTNVVGPTRVMVNSTSKLLVGIAGSFALTAGFALKYDSAPAAGLKNTDTVLSLGVDATF